MNYGYMTGYGGLGDNPSPEGKDFSGATGAPSKSQVQDLQRAIEAISGCNVGHTGIDGIFGSRTRTGLTCALASSQSATLRTQFPFIDFLLAYSGTYYPPGTSPSRTTPAAATPPPATQQQQAPRQQQAGVGGEIPWWGWGLIAAGGIGLLAFVSFAVLGTGASVAMSLEEEERRERERKRQELRDLRRMEELSEELFGEDRAYRFDEDDYDDYYDDRRRYRY